MKNYSILDIVAFKDVRKIIRGFFFMVNLERLQVIIFITLYDRDTFNIV